VLIAFLFTERIFYSPCFAKSQNSLPSLGTRQPHFQILYFFRSPSCGLCAQTHEMLVEEGEEKDVKEKKAQKKPFCV
jgi:hypothetical protein